MDNYFSSPELFDNMTQRKINCYGTVRPKRKGMPNNLVSEKRMKGETLDPLTRDDLTAVAWRGKHNIYLLPYMHSAPAEGNLFDDHGNALKPAIEKSTIATWAMLTKVTEWLTVTQ